LLNLAGCNMSGKFAEEIDLAVNGEGAQSIQVDTVNGKIDVKAVEGDEIKVYAVKTVRAYSDEAAAEYAKRVDVKAERHGDAVRIYVQQPGTAFGKSVSVSFEVECPGNLKAEFRSTNGQVRANGMTKGVDARTTNGTIYLENVSGPVEGYTTNGRVEAHIETLDSKGTFHTVNGSVDVAVKNCLADVEANAVNGSTKVKLPKTFSGSLDASTVNGKASCDLEINAEINKKNHVKGTLGDGQGPSIRLNTVNGSTKVEELAVEEVPV
ncbi:DUF4097 family beta strand repeat-containing protein, partial [bacterium]|nr:DUF4097 family beta strand repeat-containing protein [bacterium]